MKKFLLSLAILPALAFAQEHGGHGQGNDHGNSGNRGHFEHSDREHHEGRQDFNREHRPPAHINNYNHNQHWNNNWNNHRPPAAVARPWYGQFHRNDYSHWQSGGWRQERHNGRYGWWWVVGSIWYLYPQPVYPYPVMTVPPTYYSYNQPPPSNLRYYCQARNNYYPYVSTCPTPWIRETNY